MSTIKRIIRSKPSATPGRVVCDVRYPGGRAETVEITEREFRIHNIRQELDDAGINMKLLKELEDLLMDEGFERGYEKGRAAKCKRKSWLSKLLAQPSVITKTKISTMLL